MVFGDLLFGDLEKIVPIDIGQTSMSSEDYDSDGEYLRALLEDSDDDDNEEDFELSRAVLAAILAAGGESRSSDTFFVRTTNEGLPR